MPSAELVNQHLAAMGDVVPSVPDHDHEMGTGYPDLRGQIPVTLPPARRRAASSEAPGR